MILQGKISRRPLGVIILHLRPSTIIDRQERLLPKRGQVDNNDCTSGNCRNEATQFICPSLTAARPDRTAPVSFDSDCHPMVVQIEFKQTN
jgi:hypothetical protein